MRNLFTLLLLTVIVSGFYSCSSDDNGDDGITRIKIDAGGLGQYLQNNKMQNVEKLKISGSLNFNDFSSLSIAGKLIYLDIKDTRIIRTSLNEVIYNDDTLYFDFFHQTDSNGDVIPRFKNLKTIILPKDLTTIEKKTFAGYYYLNEIIFSNRLSKIGYGAFEKCVSLDDINIPANIEFDGETFADCTGLRTITLPYTMKEIKRGMFKGCTNLQTITLPSNLTTIELEAFSYSGLTKIVLPDNVTKIEHSAFRDCKQLNDIKLPTKLNSIDILVFMNCEALTKIELPANITYIGEDAFANCSKLVAVFARMSTPTENADVIFSGINEQCTLYVPNANAVNRYKSAKGWQIFKAIVPTA